jgi:hypothetical protein
MAHTWELPFGPGRAFLSNLNGVRGMLIAGWQFSGVTTWESGLPFSPTLSNNASLNSDQNTRPDQIGDASAGTPNNRNQWFNPSAYAIPAAFQFGSAARNSQRGPQLFTADWGLAKNFPLTERINLQFRWDVYNSWNNTNLGLPNTNVDTGNAGQITSLAAPLRNMQFGLRLGW